MQTIRVLHLRIWDIEQAGNDADRQKVKTDHQHDGQDGTAEDRWAGLHTSGEQQMKEAQKTPPGASDGVLAPNGC
jgi:hypothetical protein